MAKEPPSIGSQLADVAQAPSPVTDYANRLKQHSANNEAFDKVAQELEANRGIQTSHMREIARNYLGYELPAKHGRGAALNEIRDRQMIEARSAARGAAIDKLKAW